MGVGQDQPLDPDHDRDHNEHRQRWGVDRKQPVATGNRRSLEIPWDGQWNEQAIGNAIASRHTIDPPAESNRDAQDGKNRLDDARVKVKSPKSHRYQGKTSTALGRGLNKANRRQYLKHWHCAKPLLAEHQRNEIIGINHHETHERHGERRNEEYNLPVVFSIAFVIVPERAQDRYGHVVNRLTDYGDRHHKQVVSLGVEPQGVGADESTNQNVIGVAGKIVDEIEPCQVAAELEHVTDA